MSEETPTGIARDPASPAQPTPATLAQHAAAEPRESSWVSANAGSGKTRVLTDRVARLMLAGTDPRKILCLTYTKAAAAEMQNRLFETLGTWAMLGDDDLRAALGRLGESVAALTSAELNEARRLFARGLETPGGLKIQTIHAFCDSLLRRFPLEAGVAPSFQMLDDRAARALREEVLDTLAQRDPDAMAGMAAHLSGDDPDPLMIEITQHRDAFAAPFDRAAMAATLGAGATERLGDIHAEVMTEGSRDCLAAWVPILAPLDKTDGKLGATFAAALGTEDEDARLDMLEAALLFGAKAAQPFGAKIDKIPTKAIRAAHPALTDALAHLMRKVEAARPRRLALRALARAEALHRFAHGFLAGYEARKRARGQLDFDDLIDRARDLLSRPETAAWVLWRLDGGLDHILVDEAQDTSPRQWDVIRAISEEFFAGLTGRDQRTLFVVGDEKQSIYSFQGADPVEFGRMRDHYARLLSGMSKELRRCDLLYSFRSAPPVLRLVDAVFAGAGAAGLERVEHLAFHPEMPGRIELWPFLEKPETEEEPPWHSPRSAEMPDDPVAKLATRIAAEIGGWLREGRALPGAGRAIQPGDVLILVQRRGALFHAVIRALKAAGVPVAGADVLKLEGELAVKDLLAVLRVAATRDDDLSLAALLRGPLGGLSEAELFAIAYPRTGTLWQALRARRADFPGVVELIDDIRSLADYARPFELLERILIRHDGRRRLVARLGPESEDAIDALLDQALVYETREAPSLTGFLGWIDRVEMQVKRRLEDSADQARVMTVHGAKGLEAPIVILPDTAPRREGANPPRVARLGTGAAAWRSAGEGAPPVLAEAEAARRDRVRAENRRLLYVALTRARSWLIVAGAGEAPKPEDDSWYGLVAAAFETLSPVAEPEGLVLAERWDTSIGAARAAAAAPEATLPDWIHRHTPTPPEAAPTLTPSTLGGVHALPFEAELFAAGEDPLARGEAVHLLLERLRGRARADRADLAARLLPARADLAALLAEAEVVLDAPELEAIFAETALAEVEIAAPMPGAAGQRLIGRIDRLVIAPDRVLAVDFKTNRGVPETPDRVPEGILRQMGAYAAALAGIWPDRRVETAILWTRAARLMPLPAELTAAALLRALAEP